MNRLGFASAWDAIKDTPEEAENMKQRSVPMTARRTPLAHADTDINLLRNWK